MRSAPCQDTWSLRADDRSSLNHASDIRELGRDVATTVSVVPDGRAVQRPQATDASSFQTPLSRASIREGPEEGTSATSH